MKDELFIFKYSVNDSFNKALAILLSLVMVLSGCRKRPVLNNVAQQKSNLTNEINFQQLETVIPKRIFIVDSNSQPLNLVDKNDEAAANGLLSAGVVAAVLMVVAAPFSRGSRAKVHPDLVGELPIRKQVSFKQQNKISSNPTTMGNNTFKAELNGLLSGSKNLNVFVEQILDISKLRGRNRSLNPNEESFLLIDESSDIYKKLQAAGRRDSAKGVKEPVAQESQVPSKDLSEESGGSFVWDDSPIIVPQNAPVGRPAYMDAAVDIPTGERYFDSELNLGFAYDHTVLLANGEKRHLIKIVDLNVANPTVGGTQVRQALAKNPDLLPSIPVRQKGDPPFKPETEQTSFQVEGGTLTVVNTPLGVGSFGEVFEVRFDSNVVGQKSEVFAIKRMDKNKVDINEIRFHSLLSDDPNFIKYHGSSTGGKIKEGQENPYAYIVLDKAQDDLASEAFRDSLTSLGELGRLKRVDDYSAEMITGLVDLHKRGYAHNDIKSANFLLANGHVKYADFGKMAKIPGAGKINVHLGTDGYVESNYFNSLKDFEGIDGVEVGIFRNKKTGKIVYEPRKPGVDLSSNSKLYDKEYEVLYEEQLQEKMDVYAMGVSLIELRTGKAFDPDTLIEIRTQYLNSTDSRERLLAKLTDPDPTKLPTAKQARDAWQNNSDSW